MPEIELDRVGLGSILKDKTLFVPPNQRAYSWRDDEVKQLFQDYAKAISDGGDYFLGTLVTIPRGDGALEVADGQQRLASTSLLLAAIRDYLRPRNEGVMIASLNEFLNGPDRSSNQFIPKLRLNTGDNELFRAIVSAEDAPLPQATLRSNRRLLSAYNEAKKQVRAIVSVSGDERLHPDFLNAWVDFIQFRAIAVLLTVENNADAFKMFETLNDRGLRTSQADLVKNHLFSKADKRLGELQQRWDRMQAALETVDDDKENTIDFLRLALVLKRGYLAGTDVYSAVQDEAKSEQAAVTFALHLESTAAVFVSIFNPEHELWSGYPHEVRSAIEVFALLNVKPMRSLILAVAAKMNIKETTKVFRFLVSLGVRLIIATTVRSGAVETPLAAAARDVFGGKIKTAQQLKDTLKNLVPSDAAFASEFERARSSTAKLARYYLRSMERTVKGEDDPEFIPSEDSKSITLEHVLPENPEGNWPTFSDDEVAQYAKRLGNLVLLKADANSNLKSAAFDDKKKVLAQSSYELTSEVANLDEWTPEAVVARQKVLAGIAVETWPTK